ncbi:MAG: AlpA family phage regulatory protein [Gammaproteobacteria bacterium]|jgi:prophage regulatory protein|nr:AlpA family phage regulatory protein [Gammaproteobacteria bacterium]
MKILKEIDVIEIVGLSHTTLYRLMKADKFPRPIRLSPNRVGWVEDVIYKWIEEQQQSLPKLAKQGGV